MVTFRPDTTALHSIVVYNDELAFVVPPTHPLARRHKVAISELASESFVAHHVSSPYRQRVLDTFRKKRVELRMPVEMPTIDAIKKFVVDGERRRAAAGDHRGRASWRGRTWSASRCPELSFDRKLRLIHRREGTLSHAAEALALGGGGPERAQARTVCVRGRALGILRFPFTAESGRVSHELLVREWRNWQTR